MERVAALGRRVLPRGWRHFGIQLVIWFGFYFSYLGVRHLTYATPGKSCAERTDSNRIRHGAPDAAPIHIIARHELSAGRLPEGWKWKSLTATPR